MTSRWPQRSGTRRAGLVATLIATTVALLCTACGSGLTKDDVTTLYAAGWPVAGGNSANSNYVPGNAADDLTLTWTRPTGGQISVPTIIGSSGQTIISADTATGCDIFQFDSTSGRKDYCRYSARGAELVAPLIDANGNLYAAQPGRFYSSYSGSIRWRFPSLGLAMTPKLDHDGNLAVLTTQGQVLLLNAQTGQSAAVGIVLREDTHPNDPNFGLSDCVTGGPNCFVNAPPALDADHERIFVNYWPPQSLASRVQRIDFGVDDHGDRSLRLSWHNDIPGGTTGSPILSADGSTLYVFDRNGSLHALNADTGQQKWQYYLGRPGFATASVSPSGLIVPAPVLGAPVVALRDDGTKATVAFTRDDLQSAGLSAQTADGTVWVPVRTGPKDELALEQLDRFGKTRRTLALPGAVGFTTGVSIGPSGQVVSSSALGQVYYFATPSS